MNGKHLFPVSCNDCTESKWQDLRGGCLVDRRSRGALERAEELRRRLQAGLLRRGQARAGERLVAAAERRRARSGADGPAGRDPRRRRLDGDPLLRGRANHPEEQCKGLACGRRQAVLDAEEVHVEPQRQGVRLQPQCETFHTRK